MLSGLLTAPSALDGLSAVFLLFLDIYFETNTLRDGRAVGEASLERTEHS